MKNNEKTKKETKKDRRNERRKGRKERKTEKLVSTADAHDRLWVLNVASLQARQVTPQLP